MGKERGYQYVYDVGKATQIPERREKENFET